MTITLQAEIVKNKERHLLEPGNPLFCCTIFSENYRF